MDPQDMIDACKTHTLFSWSARGKVEPMPITRAKGIYLYGPSGEKWMDFNSQLMSVNIGHSHPKVVEAMKTAADGVIYAFPGAATPHVQRSPRSSRASCPRTSTPSSSL